MRLKRKCEECGKQLSIKINDKTRKIISGGCFWDFREGPLKMEYWECEKCYKKGMKEYKKMSQ